MKFDELVKFVRDSGCRVYIYTKKSSLDKERCAGYFERNKNGPYICLATADIDAESQIELLLHEFSHFMQWKEGVETRRIDNAYKLWGKWLNGKYVSPGRLEEIRRMIILHEWDAEMRAVKLAENLCIDDYDSAGVIRGANAYVATLKWCFQTRKISSWSPYRGAFKSKILTRKELVKPLNARQLRRIERLIMSENSED